MEIVGFSLFALTLALCLVLLRACKKLAARTAQLEAAIQGESTGRSIPYTSLELLNSLRLKALEWERPGNNPDFLAVRPAYIERLDDYLINVLNAVPGMISTSQITPVIEPRPSYSSRYTTHHVMLTLDGGEAISFPCSGRDQAERITGFLQSHGLDAGWTSKQSGSR